MDGNPQMLRTLPPAECRPAPRTRGTGGTRGTGERQAEEVTDPDGRDREISNNVQNSICGKPIEQKNLSKSLCKSH